MLAWLSGQDPRVILHEVVAVQADGKSRIHRAACGCVAHDCTDTGGGGGGGVGFCTVTVGAVGIAGVVEAGALTTGTTGCRPGNCSRLRATHTV